MGSALRTVLLKLFEVTIHDTRLLFRKNFIGKPSLAKLFSDSNGLQNTT
jgi:hypothetical protein